MPASVAQQYGQRATGVRPTRAAVDVGGDNVGTAVRIGVGQGGDAGPADSAKPLELKPSSHEQINDEDNEQ
jgi:hypothetical protein